MPHDWQILFSLTELCSAGVVPTHAFDCKPQVDSSETDGAVRPENETCDECDSSGQTTSRNDNVLSLWQPELLTHQDIVSLGKSSETLSFLIREANCLTEHNFLDCIHTVRTLAETSSLGSVRQASKTHCRPDGKPRGRMRGSDRIKTSKGKIPKSHSTGSHPSMPTVAYSYDSLSLQLLDLMQTLHAKAAGVFGHKTRGVAEDGVGFLWEKCWCPLLQGMACHGYDARRDVRQAAITLLQRSLLIHDLQSLSGREWELCFKQVSCFLSIVSVLDVCHKCVYCVLFDGLIL